jgi:hypothetical protein
MPGGVTCRACGVVLPERVGRCPACGERSGLGRSRAWVLLAVIAVIAALGLATIGLTRRPRVDPSLAAEVEAFTGVRRLSISEKGTEVSGHVENRSQVSVDVIVRFRGRDFSGRVVAEVESEPYRNLPPGSSTTVGATFDMTPLQDFEVDIVELAPSPR